LNCFQGMGVKIGIRHEDKYEMERRTPLIPKHIERLIRKHNLEFIVQSSPKRIFPDDDYARAGARIENSLRDCPVIFGVKEIPETEFENGKTYIFFSHVIKGQPYNMPMLRRMMELGCNLVDYERIADDQGKRLIFFGKYAGLAGMINSLWSLGQRLKEEGYIGNPFARIRQAHKYTSLDQARWEISEVGREISEKGLPEELLPLTIGFTGHGNVSIGAQEIASLLPIIEITPEKLLKLKSRKKIPSNLVYKVIFRENHISRPKEPGSEFDLQDYYQCPENYENNFEQYIPHLSVLMNCMYWDDRYPQIFTSEFAKQLFSQGNPKIKVVGDITCDPEGSIEFTHKGTEIEDPVFVYNPQSGIPTMGFRGDGIVVMAVDILPSELPRESSVSFGDALVNFVKPIAECDFSRNYDELALPPAIKKALIVHNGELTPDYRYINQFLEQEV
jgi:saccharopine dehydrogenase (NAD+, L-lysine forming)